MGVGNVSGGGHVCSDASSTGGSVIGGKLAMALRVTVHVGRWLLEGGKIDCGMYVSGGGEVVVVVVRWWLGRWWWWWWWTIVGDLGVVDDG